MPISYLRALEILEEVAQRQWIESEETVPLLASIGRITTADIKSPYPLPAFDTSAMDGYALESGTTASASLEHPVLFEIAGTMAAGAPVLSLTRTKNNVLPICVEIMTGAQFPFVLDGPQLDACIPVERVQLVADGSGFGKHIVVTEPVRSNQHRRFMGSDIAKGKVMVPCGTLLQSQHLISLTAQGISHVPVRKKVHVAVCATGSELVAFDSPACLPDQIRDSNSPYIILSLEQASLTTTQYSPVADNISCLRGMLQQFEEGDSNVLVTTGGVSAGKFDFLRECLEANGATIEFHKVAIRPGHPVLFATTTSRRKAVFGLPGNPIAAAACLQFFVVPFLNRLRGESFPTPIHARVKQPLTSGQTCQHSAKSVQQRQIDIFRHGQLQLGRNGYEVIVSDDQASYKTIPIMHSDCWVWMPAVRRNLEQDDVLPCFPFRPSTVPDSKLMQPQYGRPRQSHMGMDGMMQSNHISTRKLKVLLLAGGLSSRMKTPKHLLCVDDRPIYQIMIAEIQKAMPGIVNEDIYISLHNEAQAQQLKQAHLIHGFDLLPHQILTDISSSDEGSEAGQVGPAAGLLAAHLEDASSNWLIVACDYPLMTQSAFEEIVESHRRSEGKYLDMAGMAVTCFVNAQGFREPLLAIWTPVALRQLKKNVEDEIYGPSKTIADFVHQGRCNVVSPSEAEWLRNANTPDEWEAALSVRPFLAS